MVLIRSFLSLSMLIVGLVGAVHAAEHPAYPQPVLSLNEIDMFYDMDCFEQMKEIVSRAERSIVTDFYIFGGDTADLLADIMIEKQKSGVDVRVLLDEKLGTLPEMTSQTRPVYKKLRRAGIPVLFHSRAPIPPSTKAGSTIDHNKYFVIDGREALIGSMNLAKKFYQYHDLMMLVHGPIAEDLAQQFEFDWYNANHRGSEVKEIQVHALPVDVSEVPAASGAGQARLVGTGLGRKTALESLPHLLGNARRSIHLQMHEFSDSRVLDLLIAAKNRGVDVRILLDPGNVDRFVPVVHRAPRGIVNVEAVKRLMKAGVNVRFFKVGNDLTTAHMKSVVIDGEILFAGSINWTVGGFETVSESNLEVYGGRAPAQAEMMFEHDWNLRSEPARLPSPVAQFLYWLYHRVGI